MIICNHCGRIIDEPSKFQLLENIVCDYFNTNSDELKVRSKKARFVQARQTIYYFSRKILGTTLKFLEYRYNIDHSTIIKQTRIIENCIKYGDYIYPDIKEIQYELSEKFTLNEGGDNRHGIDRTALQEF